MKGDLSTGVNIERDSMGEMIDELQSLIREERREERRVWEIIGLDVRWYENGEVLRSSARIEVR